jgi:hypothetical protein
LLAVNDDDDDYDDDDLGNAILFNRHIDSIFGLHVTSFGEYIMMQSCKHKTPGTFLQLP